MCSLCVLHVCVLHVCVCVCMCVCMWVCVCVGGGAGNGGDIHTLTCTYTRTKLSNYVCLRMECVWTGWGFGEPNLSWEYYYLTAPSITDEPLKPVPKPPILRACLVRNLLPKPGWLTIELAIRETCCALLDYLVQVVWYNSCPVQALDSCALHKGLPYTLVPKAYCKCSL